MYKIILITSILCFSFVRPVKAQDECARYQLVNQDVNRYRSEIKKTDNNIKMAKSESDIKKLKKQQKALEDKVQKNSREGATLLERCNELKPLAPEAEETLKRWYQIAKLNVDARECEAALEYIAKCQNHLKFNSVKIQGKDMAELTNALVVRCKENTEVDSPNDTIYGESNQREDGGGARYRGLK